MSPGLGGQCERCGKPVKLRRYCAACRKKINDLESSRSPAGRGADTDLRETRAAIDHLAAVPTKPVFVMHEIWLLRLRALLARAHDDADAYADFRDRDRDMARTLGFEGHIAWAEAMP